jgi:hypothetical protein
MTERTLLALAIAWLVLIGIVVPVLTHLSGDPLVFGWRAFLW